MELYIIIFLLILIIPVCASIYVNSSYSKYKKILNVNKLSGFEVARKILDNNGLQDIHVVETKGKLSDHYDPRRKVVRLSHDIFHGETVAAIAVASHEVGHAIQDKDKYIFMNIRSMIFPIVNFASYAAYIVLIIGFISQLTNLIWLGIILVSFGVVFQIVTLPVEFNASSRANKELKKLNQFNDREISGTETMLRAAALTYVAGLVASLLELLRLILIARDN